MKANLSDKEIVTALEFKNSIRITNPEIDTIDDDEFINRYHDSINYSRQAMTKSKNSHFYKFVIGSVLSLIAIALSIFMSGIISISLIIVGVFGFILFSINAFKNRRISLSDFENDIMFELKKSLCELASDRKRAKELSQDK